MEGSKYLFAGSRYQNPLLHQNKNVPRLPLSDEVGVPPAQTSMSPCVTKANEGTNPVRTPSIMSPSNSRHCVPQSVRESGMVQSACLPGVVWTRPRRLVFLAFSSEMQTSDPEGQGHRSRLPQRQD